MMMGESKWNGRSSATLKSPDNPHENHVSVGCSMTTLPLTSESIASATLRSPDNPYENHLPVGCSLTTPPVTSESICLDMSPPKRHKLCKATSPTPRVLFDDILPSQVALEHVPEDEFFLLKPKDMHFTAPLQVLRPCAHRGNDPDSKTPSSSSACPTTSSLFTTIDEDAEDDSDFEESEELTWFNMTSSCFSASLNLIEEEFNYELRSPGPLSRFPNRTGRDSLDEGPDYNEPQPRLSERPRIRLKPRPVSL